MEKIKKNSDFQLIYNKGDKFFGHYFLLYIKKNNINQNRFGVVVSKKVGHAVCRVRLKRLFREIYRENENDLKISKTCPHLVCQHDHEPAADCAYRQR